MAVHRRNTDKLWPDFLDYFRQDFRRELQGWWRIVQYFGIYIPVGLALLVAIVIHVDPLPPAKAYLATGQPGSSYHLLAEKFAAYFKLHGVELELIETAGLSQGLKDLNDDDSRVNASFLTAGAAELGQYPKMVSLGSLKYSPVWLVYRGKAPDAANPLGDLLKRRMAVGMDGTNTRMFLNRMLALHGQTLTPGPQTYEISHEEAATRFEKGELDAVLIVDGIDSPNVQRLLRVQDRQIVEFALAPAYLKKMPALEMVTIPRGAIDLKDVFPPKDLSLLASTVTLVVEADTHPALQWLFLRAAESISQDRTEFFSKPNHFPEYVDRNVALSPVGARYFDGGLPTVFKYLPNTWATLFDSTWGIVLAVLVVGWPLFLQILSLRQYPSNKLLYDYWQDLRDLEHELDKIETPADAQVIIEQLDEMLAQVLETWVEDDLIHRYFGLRRMIQEIRNLALQRQAAVLPKLEPAT
ncbi:TAXI family TRAP transporter solute-binding subunit [Paucibacter sp. Y2R2-4]|uniref:TAXI family TRAP transporter solute-binding subunit n=1 Tax=Paucibacter sp. Y2R2-4 TaxID=2893553 RepID=UPI0021E410D0|nr:TAXI family TRAP transporter solute-binding subunit [Paucibacter sp. Y2R2-4]MCV2350575.1 hypothetical protein [Paucibacter sp. Y2R2-4]